MSRPPLLFKEGNVGRKETLIEIQLTHYPEKKALHFTSAWRVGHRPTPKLRLAAPPEPRQRYWLRGRGACFWPCPARRSRHAGMPSCTGSPASAGALTPEALPAPT